MLNESQSTRKAIDLSQESGSSAPALYSGLLARMPTTRPSIRASAVYAGYANRSLSGSTLPLSQIAATTLRTS